MQTQEFEILEIAFKSGDLPYLEAIQGLTEKCGYAPKDAEAVVEGWEQDIGTNH